MTDQATATALRLTQALATLEDAEVELRQAAGCGLDFPGSSFVAKALLHVVEAQSTLRGELA